MRYIIVLLLCLLFATTQLLARDYSYPALEVTILLQTDGSMLVQEDRSFRFWGRYSEGFRSFPTDGLAAPDIMAEEALRNNPGNEVLARYVIYGVALGLGSYHLRRFLRQLDREGYHGYLPWMIMHSGSNRSYGDVISNMVTSTATTMSSATGAGGGGGMGGGGGAASGGGGAR